MSSPEEWLRYMPAAQQQKQELRLVESAWDHLALLSSLSLLSAKASSGSDLARARKDFAALSGELMRGLAGEALRNRLDDLATRAQVCIDVLVRNLFERTADIGFFATDGELARYLGEGRHGPERADIEARLRAYAGKYTVYGNIFLFDAQGGLRASLRGAAPGGEGAEPAPPDPWQAQDQAFLRGVLGSDAAYVEHYARHGFSGQEAPTLVYAHRVDWEGRAAGVLCLEFRLADEMPAIFASVQGTQEAQDIDPVLALVDGEGAILASSDVLQLPVGWRLPEAGDSAPQGGQVVRHMGRRYLLAARRTQGFQGYGGPGWRGVALLPLDGAFDEGMGPSGDLAGVAGHADLLSEELRGIPVRSAAIQSALERSVWNGLLDLNQIGGEEVAPRELLFARTLLSEIGATARKTARAFAVALEGLYGVVTRSLLRDAQSRAALAMQILDRNLYERANDCRWWALTPQFARTLEQQDAPGCAAATAVLQEINALYTVYACLVLFDRSGRVIAVSRPDQAHHVGEVLDEPWVGRCLRLPSEQAYTVSDYAGSRFYAPGPTFIYAAAVRAPGRGAAGGREAAVLGGIAVVWDAASQLDSILADCAVGLGARDMLAFVDAAGGVVRSGGQGTADADGVVPGAMAALRAVPGERMPVVGDHRYGLGVARGQGYREFRAQDGYDHGLRCVALRHLCGIAEGAAGAQMPALQSGAARVDAAFGLQVATFLAGTHWFGIDAAEVVAAAPDATVLHAGGVRAPFLGLAQIGERVCPVVDLRSLVAGAGAGGEVSRTADANRQLVVLRIPLEAGRHGEFALRVDTLGPMLDVDRRQLQPVAWGAAGSADGPSPLIDAVLSVPVAAEKPAKRLLCRIGMAWLRQCAMGVLGAVAPLDMSALLASD
ncbi:chemotaxis signal transduction protein [Paracidovorax anthurii]|uniref:Chemotaxis signal transduction protein n=1 Tax=Paracidovorax anthurii TaxID=78229 RepID=A0A328ZMV9_9BURK|nr:chemotaxis protein CheW [Paracidovorax anthurii]RAR84197.1 chemotaxis signal transduction protein [Paracidovorax anthurii]